VCDACHAIKGLASRATEDGLLAARHHFYLSSNEKLNLFIGECHDILEV
jgi:hypothetical protein